MIGLIDFRSQISFQFLNHPIHSFDENIYMEMNIITWVLGKTGTGGKVVLLCSARFQGLPLLISGVVIVSLYNVTV
jgi:hypothetical protein